jgi:DNA-directed RNA polymerase specialized sigma24 family protein
MAVAVLPSLEALEAAGWQQHLVANLRAAVAELEPMERALAQAFYWESLTIAEVATKLNLSVATTRRRHDQVKQKLWRAMRRRGVDTVTL